MPPVISVIGKANSGKTTLLEKLIPEFKRRGYRVGTVKHHVHQFDMDKPGKDTWRHKRAGARVVALSSPTGLGVIRDTERDLSIDELVSRYFYDVDLVITEGYKKATAPKIEIFRSAVHDAPLENRDQSWLAMVSDSAIDADLPLFGLDDIAALVDFLINTIILPTLGSRLSITVDGHPLDLSVSDKALLTETVLSVTRQNDSCGSPEQITVAIHGNVEK